MISSSFTLLTRDYVSHVLFVIFDRKRRKQDKKLLFVTTVWFLKGVFKKKKNSPPVS